MQLKLSIKINRVNYSSAQKRIEFTCKSIGSVTLKDVASYIFVLIWFPDFMIISKCMSIIMVHNDYAILNAKWIETFTDIGYD